MANLEALLNKVWEVTPKPRKLDEGEYRLFQFSEYKGYAWLDGIVNCGDFAWLLETARMAEAELSYLSEWAICNHSGLWLAQSKGLANMLSKDTPNAKS